MNKFRLNIRCLPIMPDSMRRIIAPKTDEEEAMMSLLVHLTSEPERQAALDEVERRTDLFIRRRAETAKGYPASTPKADAARSVAHDIAYGYW